MVFGLVVWWASFSILFQMFGALTAISATATEDARQDFAEFGLFRCAWVCVGWCGGTTREVFAHPLPFNVIPHIDAFQSNGYTKAGSTPFLLS